MTRCERLALALLFGPGSSSAALLLSADPDWNPFVMEEAGMARASLPAMRRIMRKIFCEGEAALERARAIEERSARLGLQILLPGDPDWPVQCNALYAPPLALYLRGDASILTKRSTTMIGTRQPTARALLLACDLAAILAKSGTPVLSGGAFGIDAAAHAGALDAGGKTIAVLAGGLDRLHPREHALLFGRIAERGALVSESPPGTPAQGWRFPVRNRLMAALGSELILVQAPLRSGTHSTVVEALALGREVRVCPWSPECVEGAGCMQLAGMGAELIVTGRELSDQVDGEMAQIESRGDEVLCAVHAAILQGFATTDDLVALTGLPVETVMTQCMRLELEDRIRRYGTLGYGPGKAA
ncbi:MAG TPA: DNA-processing protein DprA [Spirochaetota bacterium]|nr:DNA-processing protein DprA [Spirochaetota bacterium]HPN82177.1 DNA-processing protein DprA [Spirochaetota bacterium]